MCQNYKSEKGCENGNKCHFRHVEAEGKLNKRSKKGGAKGSVTTYPRKSFQREPGILGSKHAVKFSRAPGTKLKFGKERVHREELSQSARLMSVVLAPKFGERSQEDTLHQERCARKAAWDLAKHFHKLKNLYKNFEEREFVVVNAHDDQKRIKFR